VKGYIEIPPEYETWNAFSRIRVWKHPQDVPTPYGWGMGANFSPSYVPDDLRLNIDGSAETVLTRLDAPLNLHTYLTYDVTNVGYYLAPKRRTLVVGAGGGRDVLSARLFNQPVIDAVEFNGDIINTVNRKFADFTGHLDQLSGVSFYRDEARNFLARSKNQYSMIQISMIDTWAASSAGAFSLTENGLYTREAWKLFIQRLYPDGILSVSRWYVMNDPVEAYRLTALAAAGLDDAGVSNPGDHLILIRSDAGREEQVEKNIFTLLLRPQAFTSSDIQRLTDVARDKGFVIIQAPGSDHPSPFRLFAEGKATMAGVKNSGLNFEPPTDDQPFFFQMQRLSDVFRSRSFLSEFKLAETSAVHIVATLLVFTILMTGITILLPLFLRFRQRGAPLAFNWMHVGYFVAIGFGFMLIEISQIQRLSLFLGHPSYSLLAVLFSILLSSGIGSFYAVSSRNSHSFLPTGIRLALLLVALILFGWLTPMTVQALDAANTMTRIAAAIGLLALPGFFMGMAFPIGMTVVQRRFPKLTPWMWGINGATSVCASVVAVAIALGSGLSATFWTGAAFYALAVSLLVIDRFREPGRVLVPA